MSNEKKFRVVRDHIGDREYRAGEERVAREDTVRHLVPKVLVLVTGKAVPKNKADADAKAKADADAKAKADADAKAKADADAKAKADADAKANADADAKAN